MMRVKCKEILAWNGPAGVPKSRAVARATVHGLSRTCRAALAVPGVQGWLEPWGTNSLNCRGHRLPRPLSFRCFFLCLFSPPLRLRLKPCLRETHVIQCEFSSSAPTSCVYPPCASSCLIAIEVTPIVVPAPWFLRKAAVAANRRGNISRCQTRPIRSNSEPPRRR